MPYHHFNTPRAHHGFTLVEMLVALALFSVVITIAVGALLMLISSNQRLQSEQSVMTNLSFALDSMTREIRTGAAYFCASGDDRDAAFTTASVHIFEDNAPLDALDPQDITNPMARLHKTQDCENGNVGNLSYPDGYPIHGITFTEGGSSITGGLSNDRIVYFYDKDEGKIYRRLSGEEAQSIVSSNLTAGMSMSIPWAEIRA